MNSKEGLSEQESLKLITDMIHKVKHSYHETGISSLLWGSTIFIASIVTFFQVQYGFRLPVSIWWIALFAIVPQLIISVKEGRVKKYKSHQDETTSWVWMVFAISLFGIIAYQIIVPSATERILANEGWQLMKHYTDGSKPDEVLRPFPLSFTSIFILLYAFPTLVTGIVYRFKPMIIGAVITYGFFIGSCFTESKYDYLFSAATALVCWFIPGIILRVRYLKQKRGNV